MEDWIRDIGEFIERNRMWAGPVLGLLTFGESLVVIGMFIPATALMLLAGGLAAAGVLHPIPVVLWCVAGAVFGDAVSYWFGQRAGPSAWRHPLIRARRPALAKARLFSRRYGVASIFLCRFMGPVRAFVPFIAGATRMPQPRFQLANLGSALIWVPVMLAPGYLAGEGMALVTANHALEWTVAGVAALLVLGLIVRQVAHARRAPAMQRRRTT